MSRQLLLIFVCALLSRAQTSPANVTSTYHFTTPQTPDGLNEAAKLIENVALVSQASVDSSTAMITFSGASDSVAFAQWLLPLIDRTAGDKTAVYEYRMAKDYVGRVNFLANIAKPQETAELITALRTVADVSQISTFTSNHALVMRSRDWTIPFAEWIIEQLDQPVPAKPEAAAREFTVGGPDFRGTGHGARVNFLATLTEQRQIQELLTVLRTVDDVQKVFSDMSRHALILRAGDTDLARAEWIIQQLDLPAAQPAGNRTFTAAPADDVTRIFRLGEASPQWIQSAVTAFRSDLKIKRVFPVMMPATIVARGTADQVAAAATWLAAHNELTE